VTLRRARPGRGARLSLVAASIAALPALAACSSSAFNDSASASPQSLADILNTVRGRQEPATAAAPPPNLVASAPIQQTGATPGPAIAAAPVPAPQAPPADQTTTTGDLRTSYVEFLQAFRDSPDPPDGAPPPATSYGAAAAPGAPMAVTPDAQTSSTPTRR